MPSARKQKPKRQAPLATQPYKNSRGRRARDEAVRDGLGANMTEIYQLVQKVEKKQGSRTTETVEDIDAAVSQLLVL